MFTAVGLYTLVGIGMPLCAVVVNFGVYFQLDPFYPVIETLFPKKDLLILKTTIRYFVLFISTTEVFRAGIIFIPEAIMVVITLNSSTTKITQLAYQSKRMAWGGFSLSPVALKTIKIYKMIQLYLTIIKPFCTPELPILIFCGSLLAIVCNFATVKMYDKVELPVYICAPCFSIIVMVLVATLVPQASQVFEKCRAYKAALKFTVRSKTEKSIFRSLQLYGIKCPYFMCKSSVRTKIVEYQMNYTMTLLISVKTPGL